MCAEAGPSSGRAARAPTDASIEAEVIEQVVSTLVISQVLLIDALHEHRMINKKYFAYAFARAADRLTSRPGFELVVRILKLLKVNCVHTEGSGQYAVDEWIERTLRARNFSDG